MIDSFQLDTIVGLSVTVEKTKDPVSLSLSPAVVLNASLEMDLGIRPAYASFTQLIGFTSLRIHPCVKFSQQIHAAISAVSTQVCHIVPSHPLFLKHPGSFSEV